MPDVNSERAYWNLKTEHGLKVRADWENSVPRHREIVTWIFASRGYSRVANRLESLLMRDNMLNEQQTRNALRVIDAHRNKSGE